MAPFIFHQPASRLATLGPVSTLVGLAGMGLVESCGPQTAAQTAGGLCWQSPAEGSWEEADSVVCVSNPWTASTHGRKAVHLTVLPHPPELCGVGPSSHLHLVLPLLAHGLTHSGSQ